MTKVFSASAMPCASPNRGNRNRVLRSTDGSTRTLNSPQEPGSAPGLCAKPFLTTFVPYAKDVVIAGEGAAFAAALVFPDFEACRRLGPGAEATPYEIVAHPAVRAKFQALLDGFAAAAGGSSRRITRLLLLATPPSAEAGELTEKGGISQKTVLANRAAATTRLLSDPPPAEVIARANPRPFTAKT